ncbi:MAG: HYR domain-containing protein, partial [Saprospiraceae bacterium]|nr:HYR domain-containing protein [Saprospiraceae bacterium]
MKFFLLLHLIPLFGIVHTKAASFSPPTDSIAPVIVCPQSQTVHLAATRCDTAIQYIVSATDDQGQAIIIQLSGQPPGSVFVPGTVVNQFLATDLSGNTSTCSFSITVIESDTVFACKSGPVVIPLSPANCSATVAPLQLVEGSAIGCLNDYVVEIDKTFPLGNGPWQSATLTATDAGKNYLARLRDVSSGTQCTASVQIRDFTPPQINGADTIVLPCVVTSAHMITPEFLFDSLGIQAGKPTITDACDNLPLSINYVDNITQYSCLDTSGIYSLIRRKWRAMDQFGNTSETTQIIVVLPVNTGFQLPPAPSTSCLAPDLSVETNGRPFVELFNRQYDIAFVCNWAADYADTIVQSGCSGHETVLRRWYLFNFCADMSPTNPLILTQQIEVNDTEGPTITCPDDLFIEIADLDCNTAFGLPDVLISDACSGLSSIQAFWSDSGLVSTITGTLAVQTDSTVTGAFGTIPDFPVGSTEVLYVATDDCDNIGDCVFTVTLADPIPPVALCDSFYHAQLPPDGYLDLPAATMDDGSSDACAALSFKAKWLNPVVCDPAGSNFTDTLQLCCLNFGDTLAGALRVYDIAAPVGTPPPGFGAGHFSECVFHVVLSGTAPPACTPPPNVTVSCSDFDPDLDAYGVPSTLNCWVDSLHLSVEWSAFDSVCTNGTITRRFQVFGENGQTGSCEQVINVVNNQHYFIRFPDDVFASACQSAADYGAPVLFGVDCEKMEVTYSDEKITNLPNGCYGILRTWSVTNTCRYDSLQAWIDVPNPNPGASPDDSLNLVGPVVSDIQTPGDVWQASLLKIASSDAQPTDFSTYFDSNANGYRYIQIIQVTDTQAPALLNCPASGNQTWLDSTSNDPLLWSSGVWYDPANNLPDLCEMSVPLSMAASDLCDGNDVKMAYKLFMDLNYDGIRETMVDSENPHSPGKVLFNNISGTAQERQFDARPVPVNQKWRFAVQETVVGDTKTAVVRFNTLQNPDVYLPAQLPYGNHRIRWYSTDGCGNIDSCEYDILLKDGLPPVVVCLSPLSTNILPTGNLVLWASDFLQYTNDNCTHEFNLQIGIRKAGTGTGFPLDSAGMPETMVKYKCDELGVRTVELWSRDLAGNASFCQGQITINDPNHECGEGGPQVSGKIATELNQGVDSVVINISGFENIVGAFNFSPADYTDTSGYFQYLNLPITSDITVRPLLDNYPLNGLTTFDLVLISKHIRGIEAIGSPFKMIAADANRSNSITTFDIVELRKLLLGLYSELPNNNSWRFVPKSLVFPNPMNPFIGPLPDSLHFQNVLTNLGNTDFWGIKIGDVNNSVVPHAAGLSDDRQTRPAYFDMHT